MRYHCTQKFFRTLAAQVIATRKCFNESKVTLERHLSPMIMQPHYPLLKKVSSCLQAKLANMLHYE